MSHPAGSWTLEGFPDRATYPHGDPPDEVQKAYKVWLESCRVSPKTVARRVQGNDTLYTAEVPGACFVDHLGGWQLMCDFHVIEDGGAVRGQAVFVEMGYTEGAELNEWR